VVGADPAVDVGLSVDRNGGCVRRQLTKQQEILVTLLGRVVSDTGERVARASENHAIMRIPGRLRVLEPASKPLPISQKGPGAAGYCAAAKSCSDQSDEARRLRITTKPLVSIGDRPSATSGRGKVSARGLEDRYRCVRDRARAHVIPASLLTHAIIALRLSRATSQPKIWISLIYSLRDTGFPRICDSVGAGRGGPRLRCHADMIIRESISPNITLEACVWARRATVRIPTRTG